MLRAVLQASGDDQLQAVGLAPGAWSSRLRHVVLLAAALHDLGKANDHFQESVRRMRTQAQGLRHEWVTYWILENSGLRDWVWGSLESRLDRAVVLWAISGHHPRHDRPTPPKPVRGGGSKCAVLLQHRDCREALAWIGRVFDLGEPPALEDVWIDLTASAPANAFSIINRSFIQHKLVWEGLAATDRLFAAVCKACLLGVDVAGSAVVRDLQGSKAKAAWIRRALRTSPNAKNIESLVRQRLNGQPERPFQGQVAQEEGRVILVCAGCGTGKTAAAYLRAARQWPGKRVYFCYPTTGTATEGFRGYLFNPETRLSKFGARLFHSREETDLEMILHADDEEDPSEELRRREGLLAWSTPIVSCTVDTVLSLLQNQRRALFAWPALAQSAFVFDEIHSYDAKLFAHCSVSLRPRTVYRFC